jgi:radical SAM protein with 4Fe4S-binding SPASM domain
MLASAKRRGFAEVLLVTNGLRLSSRDFCRRVAETGASLAVQRHVLGDDETAQRVQATLAGKPGTLARINQAFTNIEGLFPPERVAVQCCLTRPVVESGQLYAVFRYARRHGFAHVIECTKASPRFARGGPLDLTPQELASVYRELGRIEVEELGGLPNPPTPQAFGKTCHMPENGVHCLIDGTIVPCVGQPFPLGNLFAPEGARLEAILASRERAFFTDPLPRLHGHCQACPHVQACTGGCRGDAFFLTGCFSASAVQCPQLAASTRRLSLADFVPATCDACPLAGAPRCRPKAGAGRVLAGYLGAIYQDEP